MVLRVEMLPGAAAPGGGRSLFGLPGVPRPRPEADPRGDAEGPRQEARLPQADRAMVVAPGLADPGHAPGTTTCKPSARTLAAQEAAKWERRPPPVPGEELELASRSGPGSRGDAAIPPDPAGRRTDPLIQFDAGCHPRVRCHAREPPAPGGPGRRVGTTSRWSGCAAGLRVERAVLAERYCRPPRASTRSRASRHPETMKMGRAASMLEPGPVRRSEAVVVSGASSPRMSLAWTVATNPNLSPPRPRGARRADCSTLARSSGGRGPLGRTADGHPVSLLRRPRRPQGDRRRLRPPPRRPTARSRQEVRTFGTMTADLLALADWLADAGRHPRRHGIDRRLLEAGLQPPGGPLRAAAGQRPAHQAGARAQDRRQGLPSGSPSCSSTACSRPASSRRRRSASCAT